MGMSEQATVKTMKYHAIGRKGYFGPGLCGQRGGVRVMTHTEVTCERCLKIIAERQKNLT